MLAMLIDNQERLSSQRTNIITDRTYKASYNLETFSSGLTCVTPDKWLPLHSFLLQIACCTYVIPLGQGLAFSLYNVIYSWDFLNATVTQNHFNSSELCSTNHPNPSFYWCC